MKQPATPPIPVGAEKAGTLRDLQPESFPEGNTQLTSKIDAIVYGVTADDRSAD
jgi:hypothetical protein